MGGTAKAPSAKRGRKPDNRPQLTLRVQQQTYDQLELLQVELGMTPDEIAGLLLHRLFRDPSHVARLFKVLADNRQTLTD